MFRDQLQKWLNQHPETTAEIHFPGQNYTGPGTHIATRLLNGVLPKNKTDFVTMLHDIEYSGKTNPTQSDFRAIKNSGWDISGIATKVGLIARNVLDTVVPGSVFKFNSDVKGRELMMQFVLSDPNFYALFEKYDINPIDYMFAS